MFVGMLSGILMGISNLSFPASSIPALKSSMLLP